MAECKGKDASAQTTKRDQIRNRLSVQLRQCFCLAALHRGLVRSANGDAGVSAVVAELEVEPSQQPPLPKAVLLNSQEANVRLYIGTALDAYSPTVLDTLGITHIVNATFEYENVWESSVLEDVLFATWLQPTPTTASSNNSVQKLSINWDLLFREQHVQFDSPLALYAAAKQYRDQERTIPLRYLRLHMRDHPSENLLQHVDTLQQFLEEPQWRQDRPIVVLVHCKAGVSRSVSLAIAWLMRSQHWSVNEAFARVKEARHIANPNSGFRQQLKQLHKQLFPEESEPQFLANTNTLPDL